MCPLVLLLPMRECGRFQYSIGYVELVLICNLTGVVDRLPGSETPHIGHTLSHRAMANNTFVVKCLRQPLHSSLRCSASSNLSNSSLGFLSEVDLVWSGFQISCFCNLCLFCFKTGRFGKWCIQGVCNQSMGMSCEWKLRHAQGKLWWSGLKSCCRWWDEIWLFLDWFYMIRVVVGFMCRYWFRVGKDLCWLYGCMFLTCHVLEKLWGDVSGQASLLL